MPDDKTLEEKLAAAEDKVESTATALAEARKELSQRQEFVAKGFNLAGKELDFSSPRVLAHFDANDTEGALQKLRGYNDETALLGIKAETANTLHNMALAELRALQPEEKRKDTRPADTPMLPGRPENGGKSLGEVIMTSDLMKEAREGDRKRQVGGVVEGFGLKELKTTFETSAGWEPESTRIPGLVIPYATRPIQILDIIPMGRTNQAAIKYMEETTLTSASAERNETAAYAESTFALTERSSTVRSIGSSIPVSDEQLEDVEGVQSYLEGRLTFLNRQRLDYQVINGDGTAPNLSGILDNANLQTQAKGVDPVPDAVYKAMKEVRVDGRAFPNAFVVHPSDWQDVRLLRTSDGVYIWGSPAEAGPERIWGIQVVQSDVITENTGLVGDFANFCQLFERRGMEVLIGWDSDDFTKGIRTIRAGLRVAFAVYRGAAFCSVTGI